jgi:hypothetical protein
MTKTLSLLIATVSLAGCASLNSLTSEVSSYSQWPADRKPGSYAFERLPSQQTRPQQQQVLEDSARPALEAAGFTPAADASASEYIVALGARVSATEQYYDDPFWWRGGLYSHRFSRPWPYYGIGFGIPSTTYEREVALLIRDRASGKPLFEARASHESVSPAASGATLAAMFAAALADFPKLGLNPRRVTVSLPADPAH